MHFHDTSSEQIALEHIAAVSERLEAAINATKQPLSEDDQERIEQLTDRLIGLRETVININDGLRAVLRLTQEDA